VLSAEARALPEQQAVSEQLAGGSLDLAGWKREGQNSQGWD
jgi:hypothetical protein